MNSVAPLDGDASEWVGAAPALVKSRIVAALLVTPVPIIVGAVLAVVFSPWWWFLATPFVLGLLNSLLLSRRYVASLGHCEREEEILVREGVVSRSTTLIPYGRLQHVTMSEGPIDSRYGLASLAIHTATPGSVSIPGLPSEHARELRARLVDRSRNRDEGL